MRSQNRLAPISFSLALLISQATWVPIASAIPNPIDNGRGRKAELPDAPSTPPPDGNRQPGGSLSGDFSVCPETPKELTAITPANVYGKTVAEHPTFWFYMPYTAADIEKGEFSILTQAEDERIYKTSFTLPEQPGFVSITLPADEATSLQEGQYYHWYLNLFCVSSENVETPLHIDGWVQRVAPASQAGLEIWYDRVDTLAEPLQTASPAEPELQQPWTELLESVELDEFSQEPVVGPVMLIDP